MCNQSGTLGVQTIEDRLLCYDNENRGLCPILFAFIH